MLITHEPRHLVWWNCACTCISTTCRTLLDFKVMGQRSRSHGFFVFFCVYNAAATRGRCLALSKAWWFCLVLSTWPNLYNLVVLEWQPCGPCPCEPWSCHLYPAKETPVIEFCYWKSLSYRYEVMHEVNKPCRFSGVVQLERNLIKTKTLVPIKRFFLSSVYRSSGHESI